MRGRRGARTETDLEAILAGVAAASDVEIVSFDGNKRALAKREFAKVVGGQALEVLGRLRACVRVSRAPADDRRQRTLESKEAPSVEYFMLYGTACLGLFSRVPLRHLLLEPGEVAVATAGVGDDIVCVLGMLRDDCVVDNAAAFVEKDGERRGVGRERLEG